MPAGTLPCVPGCFNRSSVRRTVEVKADAHHHPGPEAGVEGGPDSCPPLMLPSHVIWETVEGALGS